MRRKPGRTTDISVSDGAETQMNFRKDTKESEDEVKKGGRGKRRGMKGKKSAA